MLDQKLGQLQQALPYSAKTEIRKELPLLLAQMQLTSCQLCESRGFLDP